jgi:hypothetical protein
MVSVLTTIVAFLCIITVWRWTTYNPRAPGESCVCDDDMNCITTSNGSQFCVRKISNDGTERTKGEMQTIAESLARVTTTCEKVVTYMARNSSDPRVQRMVDRFDKHAICEIRLESTHVAFNESKGRKVAFCMSKSKTSDDLVDDHTLEFVALHELAHSMTISTKHTDEYWDNFKFILENAKKAGLHTSVDYSKSPQKYCGDIVSDNPYYSRRNPKTRIT